MPAPPLNEDLQLAMALEAPPADEASRGTGPAEDAGEPRGERPEPPVRLHRWLVAAGVTAGIVLTAGMLALFESTDRDGAAPAPPPVPSIAPEAPSPPPAPSREKTKAASPTKEAEPPKTPKAPGPGRLSVDDSACRGVQQVLGLPTRCTIRLKATGGPVKWSVASVRSEDARISAEGGGKLAKGRATSVEVTVRPRVLCFVDGSGTGTVSFAPGGTATVTYTCWER